MIKCIIDVREIYELIHHRLRADSNSIIPEVSNLWYILISTLEYSLTTTYPFEPDATGIDVEEEYDTFARSIFLSSGLYADTIRKYYDELALEWSAALKQCPNWSSAVHTNYEWLDAHTLTITYQPVVGRANSSFDNLIKGERSDPSTYTAKDIAFKPYYRQHHLSQGLKVKLSFGSRGNPHFTAC